MSNTKLRKINHGFETFIDYHKNMYLMYSPTTSGWVEKSFFECFSIFCRNQIVNNRIDGRVQVEKQTGDIHKILI